MKYTFYSLGLLFGSYILWKKYEKYRTEIRNKTRLQKQDEIEEYIDRPRKFCPHPNYVEFNAYGCEDGSNLRTCQYTLNKHFKPQMKLCKTPNSRAYPRNFYRNSQYFNLITDTFYYLGKNHNSHISNFRSLRHRFIELLSKVIRYACNILETAGIESRACLEMKPVGEYLISAIKKGKMEKYRIHNLFKKVQIIAEKDRGRSRSLNIWKKDMMTLITLAKEFQLYE